MTKSDKASDCTIPLQAKDSPIADRNKVKRAFYAILYGVGAETLGRSDLYSKEKQ